MPEPRRSGLSRLLERPDARRRIGRAVASLMGAGLVALTALGALTIWHLVRRARLIREGLAPPRAVHLPEVDASPTVPADQRPEP